MISFSITNNSDELISNIELLHPAENPGKEKNFGLNSNIVIADIPGYENILQKVVKKPAVFSRIKFSCENKQCMKILIASLRFSAGIGPLQNIINMPLDLKSLINNKEKAAEQSILIDAFSSIVINKIFPKTTIDIIIE